MPRPSAKLKPGKRNLDCGEQPRRCRAAVNILGGIDVGPKNIPYHERLSEMAQQLPKGAFLTTATNGITNVMTIGWCLVGYMWNRPIIQIVVRTSRHTYPLLNNSKNFAISFPLDQKMNDELLYCGTNSGKDVNKIRECGLMLLPSQRIASPIISKCALYYECNIIAEQILPIERIGGDKPDETDVDLQYHMMYYGEILANYSMI